MGGEAANADTAGPDARQGVVRHTGESVACLSRRGRQQGESLARALCEMAVGLRHLAGLGLAADDGDRRVGQACQIARQVAHVHAAAVSVVREVAHVVDPILDMPVVADQFRELLRTGLLGSQRSERIADFLAGLAGLDLMP